MDTFFLPKLKSNQNAHFKCITRTHLCLVSYLNLYSRNQTQTSTFDRNKLWNIGFNYNAIEAHRLVGQQINRQFVWRSLPIIWREVKHVVKSSPMETTAVCINIPLPFANPVRTTTGRLLQTIWQEHKFFRC